MPTPAQLANLRRGGGRPPGVPNRVPADIKAMVDRALSKVGGVDYLIECATGPLPLRVAFLGLVGKCMPKDVTIGLDAGSLVAFVEAVRDAQAKRALPAAPGAPQVIDAEARVIEAPRAVESERAPESEQAQPDAGLTP